MATTQPYGSARTGAEPLDLFAKTNSEQEQTITLSQADALALIEALERPARPNAKLKVAFARYKNG